MKKKLTYGFVAILWLIFSFPLINQFWDTSTFVGEFRVKPLQGFYEGAKDIPLTFYSWFNPDDSSFQQNKQAMLKDSLRLRPYLVRLNNQIKYGLFDKVNARNIFKGKNGYFFELNNMTAYSGDRFLGEDSIRILIEHLRLISDSLAGKNIPILVALAPGKASYMPENLPERFSNKGNALTNAEVFRKYLKVYEIPTIDFTPWFYQMKDTVRYPLFTKGGFHWSSYGVWKASDTILKRMEELTGQDLVDYEYLNNELSLIPRDADYDIGGAANLLHDRFTDTLAYPVINPLIEDSSKFRPRVLTVGDSYNWMLVGTYMPHRYYDPDWRFWYYNMQVWKLNALEDYTVPEIQNYRDEIEAFDIILILFTEDNLYNGFWDFVPRTYQLYSDKKDE